MSLSNEVILRPRFKFDVNYNNENLLNLFEETRNAQSEFIVSRVDDHVFIKIPKEKQHFWSPQLHLEIMEVDDNHSRLFGLFGPNPTVWTMFMFFHFVVAILFIKRDDDDLYWGDFRGDDKSFLVAMGHDKGTDKSGGHAPRG